MTMCNCLQLWCDDFDFVTEFERNRVILIATRALLHKSNDIKETLVAARVLLHAQRNVSYPSRTDFQASYQINNLVNSIGGTGAINPASICPRDYNCGTTLWIGCLISALGEGLLGFISRVVGKLENRELF